MDVKLFCFLKGLIREIIMTERSEKKKPTNLLKKKKNYSIKLQKMKTENWKKKFYEKKEKRGVMNGKFFFFLKGLIRKIIMTER